MKKHRWVKTGARSRAKCMDCGLRRRVKPTTASTWQYRFKAREMWLPSWPYGCRPVPVHRIVGVG